jgi:tetratricopeptide (TPR) repeat protein
MSTIRDAANTLAARAARTLLASVVCAALAVGAGTAVRPAAAASPDSTRAEDAVEHARALQHAEALYLSGHLQDAQAAFEKLTRSYPTDAHIWLKYGNTLTKEGNYDGAAAAFQTATSLDPANGGASFNLALVRLAQAQGALAAAREHLGPDDRAQAEVIEQQLKLLLGPLGHAGH